MHFHHPLDFSLTPATGSYGESSLGVPAMIGEAVRAMGFENFKTLAEHVKSLPRARGQRIGDPVAVLREGRGTGSAKHHLLATVAQGVGHFEVMLTVGLYDMCEANTPGVGAVLQAAGLNAIPEAHCYLTVDHERFDLSGTRRGSASVFAALSAEFYLSPDALAERKTLLHRQALSQWAPAQGLTPTQAWAIREACVAALTHTGASPAPTDP